MTIVIDSVSKSFGRGEGAVEVLKNLSCSVQDAEICSIVGASEERELVGDVDFIF